MNNRSSINSDLVSALNQTYSIVLTERIDVLALKELIYQFDNLCGPTYEFFVQKYNSDPLKVNKILKDVSIYLPNKIAFGDDCQFVESGSDSFGNSTYSLKEDVKTRINAICSTGEEGCQKALGIGFGCDFTVLDVGIQSIPELVVIRGTADYTVEVSKQTNDVYVTNELPNLDDVGVA